MLFFAGCAVERGGMKEDCNMGSSCIVRVREVKLVFFLSEAHNLGPPAKRGVNLNAIHIR